MTCDTYHSCAYLVRGPARYGHRKSCPFIPTAATQSVYQYLTSHGQKNSYLPGVFFSPFIDGYIGPNFLESLQYSRQHFNLPLTDTYRSFLLGLAQSLRIYDAGLYWIARPSIMSEQPGSAHPRRFTIKLLSRDCDSCSSLQLWYIAKQKQNMAGCCKGMSSFKVVSTPRSA